MKQYADKHRTEIQFQIGDWVYLKLHPFRQTSLTQKKTHKLSPKYAGPFANTERVRKVAYRLKLPTLAKIHDVFHVSLLKKKVETDFVTMVLPRNLIYVGDQYEPEAVLERRMQKKNNQAEIMWLIQWKGHGKEDATWEPASNIQKRFPAFNP